MEYKDRGKKEGKRGGKRETEREREGGTFLCLTKRISVRDGVWCPLSWDGLCVCVCVCV